MKHYICTGGCDGVSPVAGACQAEDCPKHGEPLEECECNDETHRLDSEEPELSTEE